MKPVVISVHSYKNHREQYDGICISCGKWKYGDTEPDAEDYRCDECGKDAVSGVERALELGLLVFKQ